MRKLPLNTIVNDNIASRMLDLLRFLAALTVFLFHFYVPVPGYQSVMVFFVLSGYFISSSVLRIVKDDNWSWFDYLVKRITRLWIVLIPALILTFIWAHVQFGLFGETKVGNFLDWEAFIGNLFFTQGILVREYGLNGPLWSLSYEFWYYLLFPCLLLTLFSRKNNIKILNALLFIAIALFVGPKIMEYFLVWLAGAVIPFIKPFKFKVKFTNNLMLFVATLFALSSMETYRFFQHIPSLQIIPDLSIGITFAFLIYLIISFYNLRQSKFKFNLPKHLAGFSYTLYLTHYPLMHFILAWRFSPVWEFTKFEEMLIKPVIAISILLYAWIIASLTEKHTGKVRRFISGYIHHKQKQIKRQFTEANL